LCTLLGFTPRNRPGLGTIANPWHWRPQRIGGRSALAISSSLNRDRFMVLSLASRGLRKRGYSRSRSVAILGAQVMQACTL